MTPKLKQCAGCNEPRVIWKNLNGLKYCKNCIGQMEPTNRKSKKRIPISPTSDKREKQTRAYNVLVAIFKRDNPVCKAQLPGVCTGKTEDNHHMKGKENELLLDSRYWLPVCRACHDWIGINSQQAIEMGLSISRHKQAS